jgi:outer membrane immunogenic protein
MILEGTMKWGVRRLSGAALLILASTWAAAAADMAVKAPPPLPAATAPSPAWTGFYAGLNLGYGFGDDPTTESTVSAAGFPIIGAGTPLYKSPADFNIHPEGIIGGGQIGYNFQVAPTWIGGIEADFQGTGMTDNLSCVYSCGTPIVSAAVFPGFPTIFS